MSKDSLIYIIIFLISLLFNVFMLGYVYIMNEKTKTISEELVSDTLAVFDDSLSIAKDALKVTDFDRPTFLNRRDIQVELKEHEANYIELAQRIKELYSGQGRVTDKRTLQEIMDSTLTVMNSKVDSLMKVASLVFRDNNTLLQSIDLKNQQLQDQAMIINDLRDKITDLEKELTLVLNPPFEDDEQLDYKKIARIYNNMDAKKIAQLMQNMSPEKSVKILKNMNQRKVAQVLAALPPAVATQYSQLLLIN